MNNNITPSTLVKRRTMAFGQMQKDCSGSRALKGKKGYQNNETKENDSKTHGCQ